MKCLLYARDTYIAIASEICIHRQDLKCDTEELVTSSASGKVFQVGNTQDKNGR